MEQPAYIIYFLGPVKRKCMLDDGESTPSKRHSSNLLITHNNTTRAAPYKVLVTRGDGNLSNLVSYENPPKNRISPRIFGLKVLAMFLKFLL